MSHRLWQVDAFAERPFTGNPAAVVVLDRWADEAWMQAVAAENALSETAFLVKESSGWRVRWFTPTVEVALCGHATLASAWVVLTHLEPGDAVTFASQSGPLPVTRDGDRLVLDFPANKPRPTVFPDGIDRIVGAPVREVLATQDHLLCVVDAADIVARLTPDLDRVAALKQWALIVTAPGTDQVDFVSRFFAPRKGVPEDPVTGSAHCVLAPFWAKRLGKDKMVARQVSARGGTLHLDMAGDRVRIGGRVVPYLDGTISASFYRAEPKIRISIS
ncbi:putative enzyme [Magnetospirillum sp. LM-5]|uniref:PhzF family phenazine biosynthesis protein n=1 Tax=Magnetospirillum sp. LM-5 TaxID=2681466 RepID=UPI001381476A|nr:PhzF family phenazine biosynthesis protein [Magnetospirillum sp. LM-5]CAA7620068.1 putative enzyme [Magnetospirillum sp. LM-5]